MTTPALAWKLLLLCCLLMPLAARTAPAPRELLDSGHADEALRLLNGASGSSDLESSNYLCRVYYSLQDWDNAIRHCERAVKSEPGNAVYQLWMGRSYGQKASVSNPVWAYALARKTVACFKVAHELDRNYMPAARDLAEYYTTAPAIVGRGDTARSRLGHDLPGPRPLLARAQELGPLSADCGARHAVTENSTCRPVQCGGDAAEDRAKSGPGRAPAARLHSQREHRRGSAGLSRAFSAGRGPAEDGGQRSGRRRISRSACPRQ